VLSDMTVHWLGEEIPHEAGTNQWWYAATMQAMDGLGVDKVCRVIECFEIEKVGHAGSPRRAIWHKAGWESEASGKAMRTPLVEIRYNGQQVVSKQQFRDIEKIG